ncbi:MAG TPA: hypothetical protein VFA26_18880, partial [Gemmataceae bacterium]|nr:hypothetical protein [Gemmataceae bacterium]
MRWKPPLVLVCLAAFGFGGALLVWGQGRPTGKAAPDGHTPAADEAPPAPPPGFDPPVKVARAAQPPQAPRLGSEGTQLTPPAVTAAPTPVPGPSSTVPPPPPPPAAPIPANGQPPPLGPDAPPPGLAAPTAAPPASPLTPPPPPPASAAPPPPCPWAFHVEVEGGRTHLEARMGNIARFTVVCDRLTLQAP